MKRRAFIKAIAGTLAVAPFVSAVLKNPQKKWRGYFSTDWHDPRNWDSYGVPTENDDVLINQGICKPSGDIECGNMTVGEDCISLDFRHCKTVTINGGYTDEYFVKNFNFGTSSWSAGTLSLT